MTSSNPFRRDNPEADPVWVENIGWVIPPKVPAKTGTRAKCTHEEWEELIAEVQKKKR